jgi:hypothetical protein
MAGSSGFGLSASCWGLSLTPRAGERAAVQRCPVRGNSPTDRKDNPDFESPQESLHRCPPARPLPRRVARGECAPASEPQARDLAFFRHGGIYRSDVAQNRGNPRAGRRLPLVGPRSSVKDATEGARLGSSSAMSSGRLFLDRVARQQSPSPLHRQPEHNTHSSGDRAEGDISTLPARGHFYFALTIAISRLTQIWLRETIPSGAATRRP